MKRDITGWVPKGETLEETLYLMKGERRSEEALFPTKKDCVELEGDAQKRRITIIVEDVE